MPRNKIKHANAQSQHPATFPKNNRGYKARLHKTIEAQMRNRTVRGKNYSDRVFGPWSLHQQYRRKQNQTNTTRQEQTNGDKQMLNAVGASQGMQMAVETAAMHQHQSALTAAQQQQMSRVQTIMEQQRPAQIAHTGLAAMIRPEQVARLPQLNPTQKQQYQHLVSKLWDVINVTPNGDFKHVQAGNKLISVSQQLMNGMKQFRAAKQAQSQAQAYAQAQVVGAGQSQMPNHQQNVLGAQGHNSTLRFLQLDPEIQVKVNEHHFFFPPAIAEGTKAAEDWLREAKTRYGQALERLQVAKTKKMEFQRTLQQREAQGSPLNPQERQVFDNNIIQCNRAITQGQSFMEKFKEQQAQFQQNYKMLKRELAQEDTDVVIGVHPRALLRTDRRSHNSSNMSSQQILLKNKAVTIRSTGKVMTNWTISEDLSGAAEKRKKFAILLKDSKRACHNRLSRKVVARCY